MYDKLVTSARIAATGMLVAAVALAVVLAVPGVVGAESSAVVLSPSMQPALQPGDVVVVREASPAEVQVGDVIVYRAEGEVGGQGTDRVVHRVIAERHLEGGVAYRTRGDANDRADPRLVSHSTVVGELWFSVPLVGRVVLFAQRPFGQVLLVVVPALLLVGTELHSLLEAASDSDASGGEASGPDTSGE